MKKMLLAVALLAALTGAAWAQTIMPTFQADFQAFADGVANSLPISATIGLNWSHAYIGQFPHFGVGVSVGGMFLPYETIEPIVDDSRGGKLDPPGAEDLRHPVPDHRGGSKAGRFRPSLRHGLQVRHDPRRSQGSVQLRT